MMTDLNGHLWCQKQRVSAWMNVYPALLAHLMQISKKKRRESFCVSEQGNDEKWTVIGYFFTYVHHSSNSRSNGSENRSVTCIQK